jgi:hypothetical protein
LATTLATLLGLTPVTAVPGETARGIAITPRNFPHFTAADVDEAFAQARDAGRHAVFIYPWSALDLHVARDRVRKANRIDLTPVVGLSPTTLDQGRKEPGLPESVRRRAGADLSVANPVIRAADIQAARDLA